MIYRPWSRPDNTVAEEPHDAQNSPLERSESALELRFTIEGKPTVETLRPDLLLQMKVKQASSMRDGY